MFTPTVMCSHIFITLNEQFTDNKYLIFFTQKWFNCKSHISWLDAIRLGFSFETQIILIEMV